MQELFDKLNDLFSPLLLIYFIHLRTDHMYK